MPRCLAKYATASPPSNAVLSAAPYYRGPAASGLTLRPCRCGSARLFKEERMAAAFIFPGQGSQAVGMGKGLAEVAAARAVFDEVDEALGEKLSRILWEGPEEELTRTRNAQPALMAVSMAAMRALEVEGISVASHAAFVAGHSLGEYSALAA